MVSTFCWLTFSMYEAVMNGTSAGSETACNCGIHKLVRANSYKIDVALSVTLLVVVVVGLVGYVGWVVVGLVGWVVVVWVVVVDVVGLVG